MKLNDEENQIICSLPLREGWEERISDTSSQAKSRIKKEIEKLSKYPKQRDEIAKAFNTLISLGFIQRCKYLTKAERNIVDSQQLNYVLPISIAYKPDSVSTTVRLFMDASAKTAGKSSLNDCLYKGSTSFSMSNLVTRWKSLKVGLASD